mmetsp:Transcript_32231/g.77042  ORF Transcript_32231/g.77042 Transcript_32231/m.77042 type:complete len:373 (-) Transcript_32231:51-1169(-)
MRMSPDAVSKLINILAPRIQRVEYNSRSEGPILPEHIVGVGLRTLAGGSLSDIRHIFKMSVGAAYVSFNDFIDGVNTAPELAIKPPQSDEEWYQKNLGFLAKSSHHIMNGTALCIDGYFQRTNMPSLSEVTNQIAYYSGHYESYGVNCLAGVFSDLQFAHFSVISSGCTNDNQSYPRDTGLVALIDSMPPELYALGDAAFDVSERLLIPFTGSQRADPDKDAFNFYLSQLRIRVEMAFGRMVNKFRILDGKVEGSLDRVVSILTACARLHNFIIQEDGPHDISHLSIEEEMEELGITPNPSAPFGLSYLPSIPDQEFEHELGVSHTRDAIVEAIRDAGHRRPLHNINRQQREQEMFVSPTGQSVGRDFVSPR